MNTQKLHIAIVGLKNNQQRKVEEACGGLSHLSFLHSQRPPKSLPNFDHVLLMTRFIRHGWTAVMMDNGDRRKVHLHRGGISTLIEQIETICA